MTPAGRLQAAIELLGAIEADRRPADAVANEFLRTRRFIGGGDRRDIGETVWSVLRARRRLGWWLERIGAEPTPRLMVLALMVLGGVTVHRAASEFGASRFAPPALDEAERRALEKLDTHTLDHPNMPDGVRLEMPDFVVPLLRARFGEKLAAECAALMVPAPLDLRVNLLKATREAAIGALAKAKLKAEPTKLSPWGLRLAARQSVTTSAPFRDGFVEIQDEGSQLVALLADAQPGMRVADYCAGAGGKTLALAMTMQNKGHIIACDVSAPRLDGAIKRLRRAGVHNAERHLLAPGDKWAKRQERKFDVVLVDAPCTGTGTWRRNPDARLRLTETDLAELTAKQAAILDEAQRLVKPGGALIYATCSMLAPENEDQVAAFLRRHPGFRVTKLGDAFPAHLRGDYLRLSPARDGTDGFFACRLERAA
ncbi:RsmB/NOP family class I SAM-dependent RNA methyltransferase [Acidiphilium sp. AL]|uniref:RsmB/NOP family class I SAM-dependent RNA methyltransferase n=1 Tax=Acidiphilium sp. AL TaxID=2871704 RepID=UPI0021CB04BB|nr:RsmB/NOP family class I SAM-dependent RNA methyltransferase [Acidiphilium sp. AL]MCU4160131.1 RsmB/NOP family class I SAM-dependent RNA methyltransferase [Acidiphilium sp. AL]